VIRGNLLAIPIEDTVLYVEPIYIESSNETSLPEVKQVVMAYGEHIVMEETFEQSLDKILQLVDGKINPSDEPDEEEKEEEKEEEETSGEPDQIEPIFEAEELLQEIAHLFDAYREALADGKWEEAAKILTEIENYLNDVE